MAHGRPAEARAPARDPRVETSCDDTCAALVDADGEVRSNVVASQGLLHARYGGVVPEVASRRHLELVDAVTWPTRSSGPAPALDDVDAWR